MSSIKRILKRAMGEASEEGARAATGQARTYFFISGHPRSGTNWLSALMNLHPRVYCHGEFHFQVLRGAFDHFTALPWYLAHHEPVRSEAERAFADLVRRCLDVQGQRKPGATAVGDHTPRPVRPLIPEAKHLVIVRDGRDVLVSWTYHLLRTGKPEVVQEPVRPVLASALGEVRADASETLRSAADRLLNEEAWVRHFAHQWSAHVARDESTMAAWAARGGPSALRLSYERLHADTDAERARVYRFLGVDPAESAPISVESRTAPGFGREDPSSFYRKGEVGDWNNHLCDLRKKWFMEEAGEMMRALGYLGGPGGADRAESRGEAVAGVSGEVR